MQLRSPDLNCEMEALSDLFARAFGNYAQMHRYAHDGYFDSPPYDPASSKTGWDGDAIVTHFGIWRFELRVGSVPLSVAGIGGVATNIAYRKRGLMAQTASAAVGSLIEHRYDVSLLFGISDYYHAYGYVTAFPNYRYTLRYAALPNARPDGLTCWNGDMTGARTDEAPLVAMADLYNRDHAEVTMTAVRPTFGRNRMPRVWTPWTWSLPNGDLSGYVVVEQPPGGDELLVVDAAGNPEEIAGAVRHIAAAAVRSSVVFARMPPRSALGRYLRGRDCSLIAEYSRSGGAMMRIVDLHSTVRKTAPVLARRLSGSAAAGYDGRFRISVGDQEVDLRIVHGAVEVVPLGGEPTATLSSDSSFARLLFGCGPPDESSAGMELRGDAALLLPILFPDQQPSLTQWDHF